MNDIEALLFTLITSIIFALLLFYLIPIILGV